MSPAVAVVGRNGRMAQMISTCLKEQGFSIKVLSKEINGSDLTDLTGTKGIIDFSSLEATPRIASLALKAKIPLVCGTTGWKSRQERLNVFKEASSQIPIVWDANFSQGIEVLAQVAEVIARQNLGAMEILDIHHSHKKDAPSGTALKLKERAVDLNPEQKVQIDSVRFGEVAGEHKILLSLNDEVLEFTHRALSRRPFALGAIKALEWAQNQKPGLYSMKDVLK